MVGKTRRRGSSRRRSSGGSGGAFSPATSRNLSDSEFRLKMARDTLNMPDAMAGVMGGMTKAEARKIVAKSWNSQPVKKSWKDDYGVVKAWKSGSDYIHIAEISSGSGLYRSLYLHGYRYEIRSNKFGSSHFKTLQKANEKASKLMQTGSW